MIKELISCVKKVCCNPCVKITAWLQMLLFPVITLAAPSETPWQIGDLDFSEKGTNVVEKAGKFMGQGMSYFVIIVGAIAIVSAAISIWNTVNMPKEEKEHHNVPLKLFLLIAGLLLSLALVAYAIYGLATLQK